MREILYWQALNEALREEMDRDSRVFIMGEDIGIYGGSYGVTRGLYKDYGPERVRDTAISEAAIVGAGIGAAMTGMRPCVEIMYIDFMTIAMDQLVNQGAKVRYMFGGKAKIPLVVRTQGGAGRGLAGQHAQSLEAWFLHVPGLYVAMPSTPYDAKGLLKSSIRNDNPVLFIEHKLLYGTKGEVPEGEWTVPIGKADIKRQGKDVTIVTYSHMVLVSLNAAQRLAKEGIDCEVVDLRTLRPMDKETILNSVRKTGKVVVVSEGCWTGGAAAEIGMVIVENAFDSLDCPVKRVCAADVPPPMSPVLVNAMIPNEERVIEAVKGIASLRSQ